MTDHDSDHKTLFAIRIQDRHWSWLGGLLILTPLIAIAVLQFYYCKSAHPDKSFYQCVRPDWSK